MPNFICVGAEKAGTTPLFRILVQHRDVFMPRNKETHWFSKYYGTKERSYYEATHFRGWRGEKAALTASTAEGMRAATNPVMASIDAPPRDMSAPTAERSEEGGREAIMARLPVGPKRQGAKEGRHIGIEKPHLLRAGLACLKEALQSRV